MRVEDLRQPIEKLSAIQRAYLMIAALSMAAKISPPQSVRIADVYNDTIAYGRAFCSRQHSSLDVDGLRSKMSEIEQMIEHEKLSVTDVHICIATSAFIDAIRLFWPTCEATLVAIQCSFNIVSELAHSQLFPPLEMISGSECDRRAVLVANSEKMKRFYRFLSSAMSRLSGAGDNLNLDDFLKELEEEN